MHDAPFMVESRDGRARAGSLALAHGTVETPTFMPVGTRAVVKALDTEDLERLGAQMVLANTYHLMLRPGSELIAGLGGLHGFTGWQGPMLTDSGGYQVFSLEPTITEEGATFASSYDGSPVELTPESSMAVQQELGADVAMVFDHLIGLPAGPDAVRAAMERTLRWSERALAAHDRDDQAVFGIVQGGVDPELRAESAAATAALGFPGFGIGGLSVGEEPTERNAALDACLPELPDGKVRYVMGLGDTEGVLDAVARGADLFDCVWPTRLARHGKVLTGAGDYNIRTAVLTADERPLEPGCTCHTCGRHSRAYVRHLHRTGELTAHRLISIHNLHYTLSILRRARAAIIEGGFDEFRSVVVGDRS
jgi:queuine tRNA-ribosyltransferase